MTNATRSFAVSSLFAAAMLLPCAVSLFASSDSLLDPQLQNKLGATFTRRADISILGRTVTMGALSSQELAAVMEHGDGYLTALAIGEARRRMDRAVHSTVRQLYEGSVLSPNELSFDFHFVSTGAAAFVESTEYLAAVEGSAFLPELLARPEVWAVPSWFSSTFSAMGPGWVKSVIVQANSLGPRKSPGVLMSLIAAGATEANMNELRSVLETEQSDAWLAGMQACARLNNGECWDLIARESRRQSAREQLRTATAEFQNNRADIAELFLAAERAADALKQATEPAKRAQLAVELGGFLRFVRGSGYKPPQPLVDAIRATGLSPLVRELSEEN
jgi:hypothetical protein